MSKDSSDRQEPLSDEEYIVRSRPKGAFASIWEAELDELPYSAHKYKTAGLASALASKDEA